MMEKHRSIINVIEKLKLEMDFADVEFVDYWDADLCAQGLKKGNRLVYISTCNHYGRNMVDYDFEILGDVAERLNVVKVGRDVPKREFFNDVKLFFTA